MRLPSITQVKNLYRRRVLLRSDFNVPILNGQITDDFKLSQGLATIAYLSAKGAIVIITSHLGRPEGVDKKLSLEPIAAYLSRELGQSVEWFADEPGPHFWAAANQKISRLPPGAVMLLENIRFFPDEASNTGTLARDFIKLADLFVLDGFGVSHRPAASVSGVAEFLPAYAGLLLEVEVTGLTRVMTEPKEPLVLVLGGAKMETKIPVLKKLLPLADRVLLGGGVANTCLAARGHGIGGSLADTSLYDEARLYAAEKKVVLPIDVVVGSKDGTQVRVVEIGETLLALSKDEAIYDVGPRTVELFSQHIKTANTILWNGALGYFEQAPYQYGTEAIARIIAARSKGSAFGVCGGGETVEVLKKLHLIADIDLVSTGGGAMLEFLSGQDLPGIEVLRKK